MFRLYAIEQGGVMDKFLFRSGILILSAGLLGAPAHAQDASLAMAGATGAGVMLGIMQALASMDTSGLYDPRRNAPASTTPLNGQGDARQAAIEQKPGSAPASNSVGEADGRATTEFMFLRAAGNASASKPNARELGEKVAYGIKSGAAGSRDFDFDGGGRGPSSPAPAQLRPEPFQATPQSPSR